MKIGLLIVLIVSALLAAPENKAEEYGLSLGIKGGMTISKVMWGDGFLIPELGVVAGGYLESHITETFSLKTELLFEQKGENINWFTDESDYFEWENTDTVQFDTMDVHVTLNYIGVPLIFQWRLRERSPKIRGYLNTGMFINGLIGVSTRGYNNTGNYYYQELSDYTPIDIGALIGGGVLVPVNRGNLLFSFRYNQGITPLQNADFLVPKTMSWALSAGFQWRVRE